MRRATLAAILLAITVPAAPAAETAAVVNRIVYPGERIAVDSIEEVAFRPAARNKVTAPVATGAAQLEGKVAKRTLLPGRLVPLSSVREPWAIEAGVPVLVNYISGQLIISATAVPLAPGAIGDVVRMRNIDSGKVFTGVVLADGTVRVGP